MYTIISGTILLLAKIGGVASKAFAPQPETEATEEDNSDAWNVKENKGEDYWFMEPELTAPPKKKNVLFITGAVENVASNEIKERIGFTVASLAISLEVGVGSLTTPLALVDGSLAVEVTNFTSDLLASGNLRLSAAYNNIKIGAWEYLLEPVEVPKPYGDPTFRPWNLLFSASKPAAKDDSSPPPPITVTLRSEELLELTVSKTGISALKKIGDTFAKAQNALSEDDVKSTPYSFKNDVGTPITLTLDEASPFVYVKKDEVIYGNIEVAPGETADLGLNLHITSTENQKPLDDRTLAISIPAFQFSETVSVGRPQARYFPISRKSSSSGEQEGFIIDVATEGFSVAITARSLIKVKNEVDIPVDIRTPEGISIGTIQPTGSFNVPLDVVYDNPGGLYVNPTGYTLSTVPLKWDSLRTKRKLLWSPISMDKAGKGDTSHLKVIGEQLPAMEGNGNRPTNIPHNFVLTIKPQVVLNNLLPIPVELVLPSGTQYNVESGRTLNAFSLPPGTYEREFSFLLRLPNFRGQTWTGQVHLLPNDQLLNPLIVTSKDKRHKLCLGYKTDGKEDGKKVSKSDPVTISLYSSYWMVNYTGLNLFYKSADGQNVVQHSTQELGPIMIGPESSLGHGKPTPSTQIKCENSDWSQQLPLDNNTGVPTCVFLHEAKRVYQLTVSCELSSCGLTRIVTVSARYSIVNSCPYPLVVQEVDVPTALTQVPALRSMAFWPKGSANRIKVKAVGTEDYTADVPYNKPFDNVLRLPNKHGGIRASIMESSTSTSITFSKYTELEVPLLIVNDTQDARIEFHQLGGASRQANAGQSVQYAWDSFHTAESLQWAVTGNTVQNTVDFSKNEAGELVVGGKHYKWITFTRHLRRILLLSENVALVNAISNLNKALDEKASVDVTLALSGVGVSVVDNVAGKDLLYIRLMSMAPTWEASGGKNFQLLPVIENDIIENGFQNYVQGVLPPGTAQLPNNLQVSYDTMTLHRPTGTQQLRRFDYRPALKVNYKMFPSSMTVDLKVNNLQVDNQIIGAKEPICFNVTPIPHEVSTPSEVHPCIIILKASKVSPPNSSLDLISADLCVQEFDLRADMTLANNMMDFAKPEETGNAHEYYDYYKADYAIGSKKEADYYADQFARSASEKRITIYENVEIHSLKLNITFGLEGVAEGGSFTSMFMGLGSALVNITDKELAIDGLHMQHLRLTATEFGDHIYQHYKSAVMSNAMSLMCGLDVIGNPVKMFSGIGKGLSTMFKDPLQAAMSGNITEGMTSGVEGAKMIVGSVTESLSSVTGVLGKGFDSIGMGFFGSSLGAISGAFKPTGKQASEHAAQVTRMRSPRNVGPTIALKPFSQVLARGDLLKSQLDPQDSGQTIAFVVTNAQFVFLLTTTSAYYAEVQRDMKSLARKIWEAPLFFVDNITLDGNVLSLHTRQQQNLQPVLINDPGMAEWVVPKIQDAIRTAPPPQAPTGQAVGQHGPAQPSLLGGLFGGGGEQQQHQQQPSLLGGLGGIFGGGSSQPQQYQQTVIIRQQQPHIQQQTVYDQTIIIRQQQPQRFGAPPQYRPRPQPPPHGSFSFF